jgi:MFS family permease
VTATAAAASHGTIARAGPALLFATLMLGQMSQSVAFTAFVAALPQMARDLGASGAVVAQMTMALAALGMMVGSVASGWILEKAGTRTTLLASLFVFAITGAGGMILRDPAALLASRFVLGFASACAATTCVWGIASEYEGTLRARALGISAAVANCAALGTTLLGGLLAQRGGWSLAFVQYPVFGLLGLALAYASLRQVRPQRESGSADSSVLRSLWPFYALVVVLFAVMFMASTQYAFALDDAGIDNTARRSLFMSTVTIVAALVSFGYGAAQQRLTVRGTFTIGLVCMAAALAAIGSSSDPRVLATGAALMGIYVGVLGPYVYHLVTERSDPASRGRAIGMLSACGFLGGFLNPVVFATLAEAFGLRSVFLMVAVVMALLALFALMRILRQRAAAPVQSRKASL